MGSGAFFGMTEGKLSGPPPLLAPVHERMEKRTQPCSLGLPLLYHVLGLGLGLLVLIPLYCSSFRDLTISRAIMSVYSVVTLDLGRFDRFDEPRDVNRGVNGKVRKRKRRRWRRNRIRVTRRILQNSLVFQNETYERRTLRRVTSPSLFVCYSIARARASLSRRRDVAPVHLPVQVGLIARTNGIVNRPFRRADVISQLTPYTFDSRRSRRVRVIFFRYMCSVG